MRCSCCGHMMKDDETCCPRCQADQTPIAKRRRLVISLWYGFTAIFLVSLLVCIVLYWHETQLGI